MTVELFVEKIVELTNTCWSRTSRALLLAALGGQLKKSGFSIKAIIGEQKLLHFIDDKLKDRVKVLRSPTDPLVFGVVPVSVTLDENIEPYFVSTKPHIQADSSRSFNREIWLGFSRLIPDNQKRVVLLDRQISVQDVSENVECEGVVIPRKMVLPFSLELYEPDHWLKVRQNILDWAKANEINADRLYINRILSEEPNDSSVLAALVRALDRSDQSRINLPLDIVAKLSKTPFLR